MKKKILLLTVLLLFTLLFFFSNQNKKNAALASPASIQCVTVAGGCSGNHGSYSTWLSDTPKAKTALCDGDKDIAAVQCPDGYTVVAGGCRASVSNSGISHSCPTNDPGSYVHNGVKDETFSCDDYQTGPPYAFWFCNYADASDKVIAYATCCNIPT